MSDRNERRDEILRAVVDWMIANPKADFSLRDVASDIGTSARMLIYHFGTKDALLLAAVEAVGARWAADLSAGQAGSASNSLTAFWKTSLADPNARGLHLLTLQLWTQALAVGGDLYRPFLDRLVGGWNRIVADMLVQDGIDPVAAQHRACLTVAAVEGLILQALTDPAAPVDAAFTQMIEDLERWTDANAQGGP
ncbi:TetR/AcrR family transcriptional regulator [Rhodospirillaceae bacterium KN72]|uniref:TetR/AcrR family transcriptional regulator n=1 Tax=Pacificispira spongiicola TaxID=2729598 RepID=A0A7Y0HH42_9PROT|nr:TetR/AcrR family transcriptional regulator [Pacificispira spongiicola]NMM46328.1 TetR/AcrR family transcriptional regulator [Pacificispira spongiicola]